MHRKFHGVYAWLMVSALVGAGISSRVSKGEGAATTQPTVEISIDNFTFTPAEVTISPGTTVTWTNKDDVPHTATSNTKVFSSGALDTDQKYSFEFKTPGTYPYFCAVHPHMTGKIIVK